MVVVFRAFQQVEDDEARYLSRWDLRVSQTCSKVHTLFTLNRFMAINMRYSFAMAGRAGSQRIAEKGSRHV